uniref:Uncharacterized protein n=1 Tax=Panagrolaimus superbus TaxID=310955 RepID=A0A914YYX5_9BILA
MGSKFPKVQEEGIFFVTVITTTSNNATSAEENTELATDAGALSKLSKWLSSRSDGVQELALRCVANIAVEFSGETFSTNGITTAVIKLCGSSNPFVYEEAFNALNTLIYSEAYICRNIIQYGALKMIKKAFTHGPSIKLLGIKFLKIVASFDVRRLTDMIINEKFFPLILKQIRDGSTDVMKAKSAKVIKIIVSQNHEIIPSLIEEEIISVICDSLQSESDNLLINALLILQNIIDSIGYEEIREKFENSNGPQLLQNLHVHENEDIQELSNQINLLVNDVKEAATVVC